MSSPEDEADRADRAARVRAVIAHGSGAPPPLWLLAAYALGPWVVFVLLLDTVTARLPEQMMSVLLLICLLAGVAGLAGGVVGLAGPGRFRQFTRLLLVGVTVLSALGVLACLLLPALGVAR